MQKQKGGEGNKRFGRGKMETNEWGETKREGRNKMVKGKEGMQILKVVQEEGHDDMTRTRNMEMKI